MNKRKPKADKKAEIELRLSKDSRPEVRKPGDASPRPSEPKSESTGQNATSSPSGNDVQANQFFGGIFMPPEAMATHDLPARAFLALAPLIEKLQDLEKKMYELGNGAARDREWYTTEQFGDRVGLAKWTVRRRCGEGRLEAVKVGGRGKSGEWRLSHDEVLRFEREGYLD